MIVIVCLQNVIVTVARWDAKMKERLSVLLEAVKQRLAQLQRKRVLVSLHYIIEFYVHFASAFVTSGI